MNKLKLRHLLTINELSKATLTTLLENSQHYVDCLNKARSFDTVLNEQVIVNLFFEPSTRTRNSFTIAAERLGAITLNPEIQALALIKGESLIDTIRTFEAMGATQFVIRHADNFTAEFVAGEVTAETSVINAGDGNNQHPTQALIDLLTIQQTFTNIADLKIAIVGDLSHSRVANSLIAGLTLMEAKSIHLIAPKAFLPDHHSYPNNVKTFNELSAGIENVDVVVTLRIQKERMQAANIPNLNKYYAQYGITPEIMRLAKPNAIIMHPGPINRGVEIASSVADGKQSKILTQITNGVAVRMAVMAAMQ